MAYQSVGSPFLVNTHTGKDQDGPVVAPLSGGRFVDVWQDSGGTGGDSSGTSIKAQIFDASDAKVGGHELLVNTTTVGNQSGADVATLADGGFVVIWTDYSGTVPSIRGQRFDADGGKSGAEFLVGDIRATGTDFGAVAALAGGGFVVTYQTGSDIYGHIELKTQIYDASGAPVGDQFLANDDPERFQYGQQITSFANGDFIVSWSEFTLQGDETRGRAQLFDARGNKLGAVMEGAAGDVLSYTELVGGGYVVTHSNGRFTPDTAQLFDANGAKLGAEIPLFPKIVFGGAGPVAALADGGFVVIGTDMRDFPDRLYAQVYDSTGTAVGEALRVGHEPGAYPSGPSVAALTDGGFLVSWTQGFNGAASDGSGFSVRAQRFEPTNNGIDHPPVLTGAQLPLVHSLEDTAYVFASADLVTGFSDPDHDPLKAALVSASHGNVVDNRDGTFTVTPDANYNGPMTLSYTVTDQRGGTVAATYSYIVDPVNDAPAPIDHQLSTALGHAISIDLATLSENADVDGDALSLVGFDAFARHGTIARAGDTLVYTPNADFSGIDSFVYTLDDGHGAQGSARVIVTVANGGTVYDFAQSTTGQKIDFSKDPRDHTVLGSDFKDTIIGGAGDDIISGGYGPDVLTGGAGADTFVFYQQFGAVGQNGRIVIKDFTVGEDKIDLSETGIGLPIELVDHFTGEAGQIRENVYHEGWVMLTIDLFGTKRGDIQINVHTGGALLAEGDFITF